MKLTEEQVNTLIETCLQNARVPMRKWLGTGIRGYDAADAIAEQIAAGIRRGLEELHVDIGVK